MEVRRRSKSSDHVYSATNRSGETVAHHPSKCEPHCRTEFVRLRRRSTPNGRSGHLMAGHTPSRLGISKSGEGFAVMTNCKSTTLASLKAAMASSTKPQVIAGFIAMHTKFSCIVTPGVLPDDTDFALAELCTQPNAWVVVHRPMHRWATIRSPMSAEDYPTLLSVDLSTLTGDNCDPHRFLLPTPIVSQLVELAHDYRLRTAQAGGNE